jgi:hypothetical protein
MSLELLIKGVVIGCSIAAQWRRGNLSRAVRFSLDGPAESSLGHNYLGVRRLFAPECALMS